MGSHSSAITVPSTGSQSRAILEENDSLRGSDNEELSNRSTAPSQGPTPPASGHGTNVTTGISPVFEKRFQKGVRRLPFRHEPVGNPTGRWLSEEHEVTGWMSLFFAESYSDEDLVVVAVLSVFSSTHEIQTPSDIPIFLSYYAIISWIWTSQVHYDVRYEAEDMFHRYCKAAQIMLFIYIGAASGGWNPGLIRDSDTLPDLTEIETVEHARAGESFLTTLIAFAIYRFIMAVEYVFVVRAGRKVGRPIIGQLWSGISLGASCVLTVTSLSIPATSKGAVIAKVSIFYLALCVEIANVWWKLSRRLQDQDPVKDEDIAERYAAFSLIILGEGFLSLTRAFNNAITGLSESNSATYAQVFVVIAIIYNIWGFLFARFSKTDSIGPYRATLWEAVHFPLHFAILLLLAAMVNTVTVTSFTNGLSTASHYFQNVTATLASKESLTSDQVNNIADYLNRLDLQPGFLAEYQILSTYLAQESPSEDPTILGLQYFGQILIQTSASSGVDLGGPVVTNLDILFSINTTNTGNETLREYAGDLFTDIVTDVVNEALTGILWTFPAAGGALILCALRSILRYRLRGVAHHIIHGTQLVAGGALALLGLLDIGNRSVNVLNNTADPDVNPMYHLFAIKMTLPIVLIVYTAVTAGSMMILSLIHRKRGGVFDEDV